MRRLLYFVASLLIVAGPLLAQTTLIDGETSFQVEAVVEGDLITSIVWAPDGRLFWTEKDGIVGVLGPDLVPQAEPVLRVQVQNTNEQGLQSMALDPNFEANHFFYVYYTRPPLSPGDPAQNVIFKYTEQDGLAINPVQLFQIDVLENQLYRHNGGRLKFGPQDGMLYVSIGDMGNPAQSQAPNSMLGRILRFALVNDQLLPAPGNPIVADSTWAHGLRNAFAFTFDSQTGAMFATENGPGCGDEINLILPGHNYGWSELVSCDDPSVARDSGGQPPLIAWTPTIAPTGIIVYDGEAFPHWQGQLMFCSFNLGTMYRVALDESRRQFSAAPVAIVNPDPQSSCYIELAQGPDGYVYYSSLTGIYRLVPVS